MPEDNQPYLHIDSALRQFVSVDETQGARHIKPLHQYLAIRLVLEGGFLPEEITPAPPLSVVRSGRELLVSFSPDRATESEATVIGGLKAKDIDVVVSKIGAIVAALNQPAHRGNTAGPGILRGDIAFIRLTAMDALARIEANKPTE